MSERDDEDPAEGCRNRILERLAAAGPAGLTTGGLRLPVSGSRKGKACRQALRQLLREGAVGNLGSPKRPRFVAAEHYNPLEMAYDHIEARARGSGVRLASKSTLAKGLRGAAARRVDEALKVLVGEGVLVRLNWAGRPLYVHATALPATVPELVATPSPEAIRQAYRDTVSAFGYPDVLIHEVYRRLGGDLEAFKDALLEASRSGRAVPSTGDWSLSSPEERAAALYINGHPHLRIRLKD